MNLFTESMKSLIPTRVKELIGKRRIERKHKEVGLSVGLGAEIGECSFGIDNEIGNNVSLYNIKCGDAVSVGNNSSIYGSQLGTQIKIYEDVKLGTVEVDDYSYISNNCRISMTRVGKFCSIGPNLACGWGIHPIDGISTAPMFYSTRKQNGFTLSASDKVEERKQIEIGNDVFIGMNVSILDGVTIGDGAVIAAGATVSSDIPPYAIAGGVPAKVIRYRFDKEIIKELLTIKWWDFEVADLEIIEKYFFETEEFIKHIRLKSTQ